MHLLAYRTARLVLVHALALFAIATPGALCAQRQADARVAMSVASTSPLAPIIAESGQQSCGVLCSTAVGVVAGAGIGALWRVIYVQQHDEHDLGTASSITLAGILGAVAGGVAGLTIGLLRH